MINRHESDEEEVMGENHHLEDHSLLEETMATLQFPIQQPEGTAAMKNISPSVLPRFHGKATEDPDEFLFEFGILYHSYDYITEAKKLNLFPTPLKDNALRWFMSLGGGTVTNWDRMKQVFLEISPFPNKFNISR